MLQVSDLSELVYGGLVTLAEDQDKKRITGGNLTDADVLKKYGTYAYFVPGIISVGAVAFNYLPRYASTTTRLAHGFIYDLPRQTMSLINALSAKSTAASATATAQRIASGSGTRAAWRPKGIVA